MLIITRYFFEDGVWESAHKPLRNLSQFNQGWFLVLHTELLRATEQAAALSPDPIGFCSLKSTTNCVKLFHQSGELGFEIPYKHVCVVHLSCFYLFGVLYYGRGLALPDNYVLTYQPGYQLFKYMSLSAKQDASSQGGLGNLNFTLSLFKMESYSKELLILVQVSLLCWGSFQGQVLKANTIKAYT